MDVEKKIDMSLDDVIKQMGGAKGDRKGKDGSKDTKKEGDSKKKTVRELEDTWLRNQHVRGEIVGFAFMVSSLWLLCKSFTGCTIVQYERNVLLCMKDCSSDTAMRIGVRF